MVVFDILAPISAVFSGSGIWTWNWQPSILIGLAAWTMGYILLVGPIRRRAGWNLQAGWLRQATFHLGTLVAIVALVSPLDTISDIFLLSAHMIQHLLLLMVAPPLWLMGIPRDWFSPYHFPGRLGGLLRWLTQPVVAFLVFNGTLWIWHIPTLYDAALYNENVHILEHVMFLSAAVIGWWPILGFLPSAAPRSSYPVQIFYLFAMMISSTAMGAFISLAKNPIYPFYNNAPGVLAGLPLPPLTPGPRLWGLSVMDDQQIAGLVMWVPGNMIYFFELMLILGLWFRDQEHQEYAPTSVPTQQPESPYPPAVPGTKSSQESHSGDPSP